MIGQTTLLASAFVVPLGMLLLCLWPQVLNRMPSLLAFAPFPALAAVLLVAGGEETVADPGLHRP